MRYANFPGCSASTTGKAYTESFSYVARHAGIEIDEVPDWNCCGASAGRLQSDDLGDALPARSLANAEAAFGDEPVLALCAGCYSNLRRALVHARESEDRRRQIEALIGQPYEAKADVVCGIDPFLEPEVAQTVKARVTQPLNGLKVACYYGCALVRPRALTTFDDEEDPQSMEAVVKLTGAEPVEWGSKTECCGASHHVSNPTAMKPLVERILADAIDAGAEAIATACPLCNMNLDMREAEINKARAARGEAPLDIPVYFFTQLLASAMGASDAEAGITRNFVPGSSLLAEAKTREVVVELTPEQKKAARIAAAKKQAAARKAAQAAAAAAPAQGKEEAHE